MHNLRRVHALKKGDNRLDGTDIVIGIIHLPFPIFVKKFSIAICKQYHFQLVSDFEVHFSYILQKMCSCIYF